MLQAGALETIEEAGRDTHVSAATAWEISTKVRIGKRPDAEKVADRMRELIELLDLTPLSILIAHVYLAGSIPGSHKDPFDRVLAAQAEIENLLLVTADPAFALFGTTTLWR